MHRMNRSLLATILVGALVVAGCSSTDDTGVRALAAAAEVLALPVNRGKGAALGEAVEEGPEVELLDHALLLHAVAAVS